MQSLGDPDLHFFITRAMARLIGVNLGDALRDGRLQADQYFNMVTECRGCAHAGACQQLMAEAVTLPAPPKHCVNRQALSQLRLN